MNLNPRRFDLVVFDWDGTLLDSAGAIVRSIQAACADLGLAVPDDARARHVIGLGLEDALRHAVPDLSASRYPEMVAQYRRHYLSGDHALTLFDGAAELVMALGERGYLLAVATGKSRAGLDRALTSSGLRTCFDATRCADECASKPNPQMLEELLDVLQVAPQRALMIGDTTHDLLMARSAGVPSVAVSYGAHDDDELRCLSPLACVSSVVELTEWLERNG